MVPKQDPWGTLSEWCEVYQLLYGADKVSREDGLAMVRMWQVRTSRLPLSIECTAELLQATLEAGSIRSTISTYSLAIIRFVNGVVDKAQGGMYARSVASVASELGLPDWMIDVRHDATHKTVPSLECLRLATRTALTWLDQSYWSPQYQLFIQAQAKVEACLDAYLKCQRAVLAAGVESKKVSKADVTRTLESITSFSAHEQQVLAEIISARAKSTDLSSQPALSLWKPLFIQLDKYKPSVLSHLLYELSRTWARTSSDNIYTWLNVLIREGFLDKSRDHYRLYVELILTSSNHDNSRDLSTKILEKCFSVINGNYMKLYKLFKIMGEPVKDQKLYSTEDLISQSRQLRHLSSKVKLCTSSSTNYGGKRFKLCIRTRDSGSVWDGVPLGSLPWDLTPSMKIPVHEENHKQRDDYEVVYQTVAGEVSDGGENNEGADMETEQKIFESLELESSNESFNPFIEKLMDIQKAIRTFDE